MPVRERSCNRSRAHRDGPSLYTISVPGPEPQKPDPAPPKLRFAQRLAIAIVPPLAALLIRLLGLTLRYQDRADPGVTPGHLIPRERLHPPSDLTGAVETSFDGELIARTLKRLGFCPVRGSSSRGGAIGLRNMQLAYAEGHCCAITADGPRGPIYIAKPGTARLANSVGKLTAGEQPTGTWVGCFHNQPERAWQLRSWDRFMIPKPFSRVVFSWPAHIPAGEVTTAAVQTALDRAVAMAEEGS